jgi:ribosomal protein L33
MAKKKKLAVLKVVLMTEDGYCHYTTRNQKNRTEKLALKKYNPKTRKHELMHEKKLAKSAKKI